MSNSRYTEEFKRDAVTQITDRGCSVKEVSERLGISTKSLYYWRSIYSQPEPKVKKDVAQNSEIQRLKLELACVTEERDILRKGHGVLRKKCQMKYAFIKLHRDIFRVRSMCRILRVHPSGFYIWLKDPLSNKAKEDNRLTGLLKQAWLENGCVYGYRKLHADLRSIGEICSPNKIARITREAGIRAQIGYKRKKGFYGGKPAVVAPNQLNQNFEVPSPDQIWVTDITYIKTYEGWLYLAVVLISTNV